MAQVVYNKDGSVKIQKVLTEYNDTFLKVAYLKINVKSPSVINFNIGDYIIYNGVKHKLYDLPQPKKTARANSCEDAFEYLDVKFYAPTKELELLLFKDYVLGDSNIHYTTLPEIATFESVYGLADRIQANLNIEYPNQWKVSVVDTNNKELTNILNEVQEFSVSNTNCLATLEQIYNQWKIGWMYESSENVNHIIIGKSSISDSNSTNPFLYGKNKGLRFIKKVISADKPIFTKLLAYGTGKNLPSRYYNNLTFRLTRKLLSNFEIYEPYHLITKGAYVPNLLIPSSKWGKKTIRRWLNIDVFYTDFNKHNKGDYAMDKNGDFFIIEENSQNSIKINGTNYAFLDVKEVPDFNKMAIYADSEIVNKHGIREKCIYFDGNDETKEVFPSIQNVDFKELREAKYNLNDLENMPSYKYSNNERVDKILSAQQILDDGSFLNEKKFTSIIKVEQAAVSHTHTITNWEHNVGLCVLNLCGGALFQGRIDSLGEVEISFNKSAIEYDNYLNTYTSTDIAVYIDEVLEYQSFSPFITRMPPFVLKDIKFKNKNIGDIKIILTASFKIKDSDKIINSSITKGFCEYKLTAPFSSDFSISLKQIGFDISKPSSTNNYKGTLLLCSGQCAGREFNVKTAKYNDTLDSWDLICEKQKDEQIGQYFPNNSFQIKKDDEFAVVNIAMPSFYVEISSIKLYNEALKKRDEIQKSKIEYDVEIDNFFIAKNPQIIKAGMYVPIQDTDLGNELVMIENVTIKEDEKDLDKYAVTLRNEKKYNLITQQKRKQSNIQKAIKKITIIPNDVNKNLAEQIEDNLVRLNNTLPISEAGKTLTKQLCIENGEWKNKSTGETFGKATGKPFEYKDFTEEQLEALKGEDGQSAAPIYSLDALPSHILVDKDNNYSASISCHVYKSYQGVNSSTNDHKLQYKIGATWVDFVRNSSVSISSTQYPNLNLIPFRLIDSKGVVLAKDTIQFNYSFKQVQELNKDLSVAVDAASLSAKNAAKSKTDAEQIKLDTLELKDSVILSEKNVLEVEESIKSKLNTPTLNFDIGGDNFISYPDEKTIRCYITDSLGKDITSEFSEWSVSRDTHDYQEDISWSFKEKVKNFKGVITLVHNSNESDIGYTGSANFIFSAEKTDIKIVKNISL